MALHSAYRLSPFVSLRSRVAFRGLAAQAQQALDDEQGLTVRVAPFKTHKIEQGPSNEVETSKKELLQMFKDMYRMRRMEISADMMYKQKLARGFLHLADGQEAVPVGMEASLTFNDSVIQSYRDHTTYLGRGGTVKEVIAELLGRVDGAVRGLGGSMHLYKRENGFYGGMGIVGTHIPLGAGLGLAHKIRKDGNVAIALYGDGAANQGQAYEAYNISAIWELPTIFVIENNHFGMGTAERRASKSVEFFTRGDYVPGLWVDGMDVLAVKAATAFARTWALERGPIVLEMDTYRYHGHSISDPGSTYRTRDDISTMRQTRDPIEHVRHLLTEHNFADAAELKQMEKAIKKEVADAIEDAKRSPEPPIDALWNNIYADGLGAELQPIEMGRPKIKLPQGRAENATTTAQ